MIKCHIKRGKPTRVKVNGTTQDLMTETAMVVSLVYKCVRKHNPDAAEKFKYKIIGLLLDPKSPVWEEGDHDSD